MTLQKKAGSIEPILDYDVKHLVKFHAAQNIPLSYDEAYRLGWQAVLSINGDELSRIQSTSLLTALHNQATYSWTNRGYIPGHDHYVPQNAAEQVAGVCAAIFNKDISQSEKRFVEPNVPFAVDNCGMGGDIVVTANVSTISAILASGLGVPMCKHGSPSNTDKGRHGSSDFISNILGFDTYLPKHKVEEGVEQVNFGYTEALNVAFKGVHLQTHKFAMMPHMNDIIGPITNPLSPRIHSRKIIGVNHLMTPRIIAEAYKIMNDRGVTAMEHFIGVRGFIDSEKQYGVDEISICSGGTLVSELCNGKITDYHLHAADFGLDELTAEQVSPPDDMSKGEFSRQLLFNTIDHPAIDMIFANTAMVLYVAQGTPLKDGVKQVRNAYYNGTLQKHVHRILNFYKQ